MSEDNTETAAKLFVFLLVVLLVGFIGQLINAICVRLF